MSRPIETRPGQLERRLGLRCRDGQVAWGRRTDAAALLPGAVRDSSTRPSAVDAFFTAVATNQPPKIFVAHSKFVILSAHKLVFIGDTLSRQAQAARAQPGDALQQPACGLCASAWRPPRLPPCSTHRPLLPRTWWTGSGAGPDHQQFRLGPVGRRLSAPRRGKGRRAARQKATAPPQGQAPRLRRAACIYDGAGRWEQASGGDNRAEGYEG